MAATNVPDVGDTDLARGEMEKVAEECGIDADGLDDQQLLERLGVALGEMEQPDVGSPDGERGEEREADGPSDDGLRGTLASKLQGAVDKLRTDNEEPSGRDGPDEAGGTEPGGGSDDGAEDSAEQSQPGEQIEGPTRNELRDELQERGLPVSGTKAELQERLDEARGEQAGPGSAEHEEDERLRDRVADRLSSVSERLRESGEDDDGDAGDSGGPSKVKRAGKAVRRKLTPG